MIDVKVSVTVWRVGGEGFEGIILYLYGSCPGLGDKRRLNLKQEQAENDGGVWWARTSTVGDWW